MSRKTDRIRFGAACSVVASVLATTFVHASDCPDFGVSEDAQTRFCAEFQNLLYAPYNPDSHRGNEDRQRRDLENLLKTDPLWGEVYRSDPKKTLELIDRIRQAGGLPQN